METYRLKGSAGPSSAGYFIDIEERLVAFWQSPWS
jgi:hypothetical protein